MKIKTGYRVVRDSKPNKKTGFYTSITFASYPVRVEDMSALDVEEILYGLDNLGNFDKSDYDPNNDATVVERYVKGDSLFERKANRKTLINKLYKKFGKSVYWSQIYMTKEWAKKINYDWDNYVMFRIWVLTKNGLVSKDVVGDYDSIDKMSIDYLQSVKD